MLKPLNQKLYISTSMDIKLGDDYSQFSKGAKDTFVKHLKDYAKTLKDESERVAASRKEPDANMTVTRGIVESMIGVHGHHVFRKPHLFFTYFLPVLEAIAGGLFCNAFFKETKTTGESLLMAGTTVFIIVSIFLRHHHDSK